jgi:hypothetical protein
MNKDSIDASIGLRFTLELLKRYRESGLLQATISRLPGISGKCQISITVIRGEVVSCLAKDQKGQRYTVHIQVLLKLDKDRGPFEWTLLPLAQVEKLVFTPQQISPFLPRQPGQNNIHPNKLSDSSIPHVIADFDFKRFKSWDPKPQKALFILYSLVDGKRTIKDIKQVFPLPSQLVEEGLHVLLSINAIAILAQ